MKGSSSVYLYSVSLSLTLIHSLARPLVHSVLSSFVYIQRSPIVALFKPAMNYSAHRKSRLTRETCRLCLVAPRATRWRCRAFVPYPLVRPRNFAYNYAPIFFYLSDGFKNTNTVAWYTKTRDGHSSELRNFLIPPGSKRKYSAQDSRFPPALRPVHLHIAAYCAGAGGQVTRLRQRTIRRVPLSFRQPLIFGIV